MVIRVSTSPTEVISIHGYDHSPYKSKENSSLIIIQYSMCTQLNMCALVPALFSYLLKFSAMEYVVTENANLYYIKGKFSLYFLENSNMFEAN